MELILSSLPCVAARTQPPRVSWHISDERDRVAAENETLRLARATVIAAPEREFEEEAAAGEEDEEIDWPEEDDDDEDLPDDL